MPEVTSDGRILGVPVVGRPARLGDRPRVFMPGGVGKLQERVGRAVLREDGGKLVADLVPIPVHPVGGTLAEMFTLDSGCAFLRLAEGGRATLEDMSAAGPADLREMTSPVHTNINATPVDSPTPKAERPADLLAHYFGNGDEEPSPELDAYFPDPAKDGLSGLMDRYFPAGRAA